MRSRTVLAATIAMAVLAPMAVSPAHADPNSDYCLTTTAPAPTARPHPISFGITPLAAGSAGAAQLDPVPHDPARDLAALRALRPAGTSLVLRLNRLFWSDGDQGIQQAAALVDSYARAGFTAEAQVRYHPPAGEAGDMKAWEQYVQRAARVLGRRRSLTALSITNEANFTASPNTSDGAYDGVREAIVRGTVAARRELDRIGRPDVKLGFSFAWRWAPNSDKAFWDDLGQLGTPEFRAAVDYVGLQLYPDLVWPPTAIPGRTLTQEVIEPLTLMRQCYLPKAKLGKVHLWITENGYATNLGRSEQSQDASLRETVEAVHRWSGTLGVTDYRWFNLRDNRSNGTDLFDAVGLLRDDYTRKPSYGTFRRLVAAYGTAAR